MKSHAQPFELLTEANSILVNRVGKLLESWPWYHRITEIDLSTRHLVMRTQYIDLFSRPTWLMII
jgi:hypothetical protein